MKLKLSDTLSKIVYALLAVLFVWALVKMHFISYYAYSAPLLITGTLAALGLMLLFWRFVKKREPFFEKHYRLITAGFLLFMFALQLAFSGQLSHFGAPLGTQTVAPSSISAWVIAPQFGER